MIKAIIFTALLIAFFFLIVFLYIKFIENPRSKNTNAKYCKYCYEERNSINYKTKNELGACDTCYSTYTKLRTKYRWIAIGIGVLVYFAISFLGFLILNNTSINYIITPSIILIVIIANLISKSITEDATKKAAKARSKK